MGIAQGLRIKSEIKGLFEEGHDGLLFNSKLIDESALVEFKDIIDRFGSLPTNISLICDALGDVESDIRMVVNLFEGNPALAGRLLKLVNSSYYGHSGQISSLRRALAFLGFDTIRSLILGEGVFIGMRKIGLPKEVSIRDLWVHSVAVSRVAERIAIKVKGVDKSLLVSAGLLHDSGKLLLAGINSEGFQKVVEESQESNSDLLEKELEITGFTHPILSTALCLNWNLPRELDNTILFQQHPSFSPHSEPPAILMLSEWHVRRAGIGSDGQPALESPPEKPCEILGLSQEKALEIVTDAELEEIAGNISVIAGLE